MMREPGLRRILLVAIEPARSVWHALLPADWEVGVTGNIEHARLIQEVGGCDVVLLLGERLRANGQEALNRLVMKNAAPVILLADRPDETVLHAIRRGAVWLPAMAACEVPELLFAVLDQALVRAAPSRPLSRACECQIRIDRLLDLLWQVTPGTGPGPWFSHRHMLERLDEEVARTQRDGTPLSVILGEVQTRKNESLNADQRAALHEWAARQIGRSKRRCDVAGQYGLGGFMLVLPRVTPDQAKGACRRLREVLSHPPQGLPAIHATFGHAGVPDDQANLSGLLSRAERRLEDSRLLAL